MNFNLSELQKIDVAVLLKRKDIMSILIILIVGIIAAKAIYQKESSSLILLKDKLSEQSQVNKLSLEIGKLETNFTSLQKDIPLGTISTVNIVDKITQLARRRNVNISSIGPKSQQDSGLYWEFPVEIEITANYRQIAGFLNDLEKSGDFLRVDYLSVTSEPWSAEGEVVRGSRVKMVITAVSWKK